MNDPYRLSLSVTSADGRVTRWGPDEPDGRDVPQDLQFGESIPGGNQDLQCSLFREIRRSNADNALFDSVRCYGPGNETAWEGYFSQFPREHGDQFSVQPGAVGWIASLGFDPAFSMDYVNADAGAWQGPVLDRKTLLGAGPTWDQDYGAQAQGGITFTGSSGNPIPSGSRTELHYVSPAGCKVGKFIYKGSESNTANVEAATLYSSDTEDFASITSLALTLDSTLRSASPTAARYAMLRALASGDHTPAAGSALLRTFAALAVYGDHGLTTRSIDADTPDGLYGSDIIADILARTGPMLTYTTGAGGSIEPTSFAIPHLVFDGVTGMDAIQRVAAFGTDALLVPEWGAYGREFFYRTPDPDRLCWQARVADGARLKLEGEQTDDLYNGVVVSYQNARGIPRVVGPPAAYWHNGRALADNTDIALVNTDATNPVNAHGIPRKWAKLELSQPATTAAATQLGAIFLAEKSRPQRRGEITLSGLIQHPTIAQPQPVWKPRAGDHIVVTDGNPDDREIKRRIVQKRYTHNSRECVLTLDNSALRVDALLEMLQAGLVGRIQ